MTQPFYSSLEFVRELLRHLLDFLVQNEDNTGRHTNSPDGLLPHPARLTGAPIPAIPTIFMPDALPGTTLPIYPGLGQAPNIGANANLELVDKFCGWRC